MTTQVVSVHPYPSLSIDNHHYVGHALVTRLVIVAMNVVNKMLHWLGEYVLSTNYVCKQ